MIAEALMAAAMVGVGIIAAVLIVQGVAFGLTMTDLPFLLRLLVAAIAVTSGLLFLVFVLEWVGGRR